MTLFIDHLLNDYNHEPWKLEQFVKDKSQSSNLKENLDYVSTQPLYQ